MVRFLSFLPLSLLIVQVTSFNAVSTSSFGGSLLSSSTTAQNGSTLDMKKGKANVPPQMRSQYKRQREMADMRQQMVEASQPGADGLPVFNLFVRTKRQNVSERSSFVTNRSHEEFLHKTRVICELDWIELDCHSQCPCL